MLGEGGLSVGARFYIAVVVCLGAAVLGISFWSVAAEPPDGRWILLAGLTLLSGSITVRIPSVPATLSVSEAFVYTTVLLFGPAAAALIASLDGLVMSLWLQRRRRPFYRVAFNATVVALSTWIAAAAFYATAGVEPLATHPTPIQHLLLPLAVLAGTDFLLNTGLVASAIALEQRLSIPEVWKNNFPWLSLNFFSGASMAALLVAYTRELDVTVLWVIVPLLVISYLTHKTSMARVEDAHRHLTKINGLYMSTIEALAMAIDAKDQITHGHIRRVQVYATNLARELGINQDRDIRAIEAAALLHDMGKLAVPEYILNKPGRLTPAEFEKMKLHATVGAEILSSIDFPYPVVPIVRHHHESWDGTGYPDGLKGTDIPVGARILSVVDCFDALTSDRPYRPRLSDDEAIKILRQRSGEMYDPAVVEAFVRIHSEIAPSLPEASVTQPALMAIAKASKTLASEERASGLEQIRASASETLTLYDLAKSLSSTSTLQSCTDTVAAHLRRLLPLSVCAFYMLDANRDELVAAVVSGERPDVFTGHRIPLSQRVSGWVAANRQTIVNSDSILDIGDGARSMSPRLRSCLSTPLLVDNQVAGTITVHSTAVSAFSDDHARILEAVAQQTARTLRDTYELERKRERSAVEQVTALPDLEQLQGLFGRGEQEAGRAIAVASVLLVRLEGLGYVLNVYGREAADEMLASIIRAVRSALRGADILFRKSDEEFAVALPQADLKTLSVIAGRILSSVQEALHQPPSPEGIAEHVNVRTAAASSPADGTVLAQLLEVARGRLATVASPTKSAGDRPPFAVH